MSYLLGDLFLSEENEKKSSTCLQIQCNHSKPLQIQLGIMERVPSNEKDTTNHYIPYHAVINPDKVSTNFKVVYDASAKINKGRKGLDERLYSGPTMIKYLTGILLRFLPN